MVALGKQQCPSAIDPLRQRLKEFAMTVGDLQQLPCALIVVRLQPKFSFYLGDRLSQFRRRLCYAQPLQEFSPLLKFLVTTRVMAYADKIKRVSVNKKQLSWP